jgi:hypothetical protein
MKIRIPQVWTKLIEIEFEDRENGVFYLSEGKLIPVTSERNLKGNSDPDPHYDDYRMVQTQSDGYTVEVSLASGQNNYFGGIEVWGKDGEWLYEDVLENFNDFEVEIGGRHLEFEFIYEKVHEFGEDC